MKGMHHQVEIRVLTGISNFEFSTRGSADKSPCGTSPMPLSRIIWDLLGLIVGNGSRDEERRDKIGNRMEKTLQFQKCIGKSALLL